MKEDEQFEKKGKVKSYSKVIRADVEKLIRDCEDVLDMYWENSERTPKRIKCICRLLEVVWNCYPFERLGQFLLNHIFGSHGKDTHIFFKEDNEVITLLKRIVKMHKGKDNKGNEKN